MTEARIADLYEKTKTKWIDCGADDKGYAIFYSPVIQNPKMMIIGYNPGGNKSSFDQNAVSPPEVHEYETFDYRLARNMRTIFKHADLEKDLYASVKLNLIFFRSQRAKDVKADTGEWCKSMVKEIITNLKPETIIAEGFATFDALLNLLQIKENNTGFSELSGKRIGRKAENKNKPFLLGLRHPSGSYGISDLMLTEMGKFLKGNIPG